jgi:microcystin-dependent protein
LTLEDDVIPGMLIPYAGGSVPFGYLLCDGSSLLRSSYAALFAAIGVAYGAADPAHFNIPDLRGRLPIGTGQQAGGTLFARGDVGGEEKHTLDLTEIPAHNHELSQSTDLNSTGGSSYLSGTGAGVATTDTGGGSAHNTLPPYQAVAWLIKT